MVEVGWAVVSERPVAEEKDGWRLTGVDILEQDRVAESSTDGSTPEFGHEFEL